MASCLSGNMSLYSGTPYEAVRGRVNPQPTSVRYNDWRQVMVEPLDAFTPTIPVSVIIPYYQTPAETLDRTLAALERQTYPRDMFEVIIVDDGSEPPLEQPRSTSLDVKVMRQERRGFGAPRARNTGARAAAHNILLFLDSDVLTDADWMMSHARWHHAVSDALTCGLYTSVSAGDIAAETVRHWTGSLDELFSDCPCDPPRTETHLVRTNGLTSTADDLFRIVLSGNLGVSRKFYEMVGGFNESFTRWGIEDTEFGYRAYTFGALLIPVRDALVWHQGRWKEDRGIKHQSLQLQRGKAAHFIAHPEFRDKQPGRIFAVPQYVVTIDARHSPADQIIRAVVNVLADHEHDLVIRIEAGDSLGTEGLMRLQDEFGADPRVRVAPTRPALDEFAASPFHVKIPAAVFAKDMMRRLRSKLGSAVTATSALPDGSTVSITRAWALHRAHRTGKSTADFGDVRMIRDKVLKPKRSAPAGHPTGWRSLLRWVRDIRSPGDAWAFLRSLVVAVRWRVAIKR